MCPGPELNKQVLRRAPWNPEAGPIEEQQGDTQGSCRWLLSLLCREACLPARETLTVCEGHWHLALLCQWQEKTAAEARLENNKVHPRETCGLCGPALCWPESLSRAHTGRRSRASAFGTPSRNDPRSQVVEDKFTHNP